jgi:hypothetical protein
MHVQQCSKWSGNAGVQPSNSQARQILLEKANQNHDDILLFDGQNFKKVMLYEIFVKEAWKNVDK